ncbi:MAG TPA: cellulose binding domain-containing protein [Herpetosiphonaceae bacterium]
MRRQPRSHIARALLTLVVVLGLIVGREASLSQRALAAPSFVTRSGTNFVLDGRPFYFGGTNNYYLIYKSNLMVDDVLNDAVSMNLRVIRSWAFIDRGSLDGSVPNVDGSGEKDGIYFQYWDRAAGRPAYNNGANGLQKLDYVLARAGQLGLKVTVVLTNNWKDFGGMDQYVTWYGLPYHDQFYTDARVKQAYKNWAAHLINRVNSITGVRYRDDPAIFAWELANEPRCINANKPTSGTCTTTTITNWTSEMSAYIKQLDPNHMVAVGDEGFLNWGRGSDWPYNAADGVDFEALLRIPSIDFGTYHLYPDHWGKTDAWGTQWIRDHISTAQTIGKPSVLEEFGFQNKATRDGVYQTWTNTVYQNSGNGWMFWILSGVQDNGSLYPDYDGFTVYYPSSTATLLANAAQQMKLKGGSPPNPTPTPTPPPNPTPTPTPPPPTGGLKVQYRAGDTNVGDNQIKPHFNVVNTGTTSVPLSELKIRYWYTIDGDKPQNYWCDYATVGCGTITARFVKLTTPRTTADYYLEVGFTGGTLAPGASTGEIQNRFSKSDWTTYTESNDYSFDPTKTVFTDWSRVTLYRNGTRVWGTEP